MLLGKVKSVSEAQKRGKLLIDQITLLSARFQRCYFINFTYIFWGKKSLDLGFKIKILSLFKPSRVYYMWGIALCASFEHPQRSCETGAIISVKEATSAVM